MTTVATQTTPETAQPTAVRQRIESADQPTHPLRRHLHAARQSGRGGRFKALLRLRLRALGTA